MTDFTPEDLQRLAQWDTPTICNGLELVVPARRALGFTVEPFAVLAPDLAPIVGYARTATIRAMQPPPPEGAAARADYYGYVAESPGPTVMVIQDLDSQPGYGAWWGEVNTAIHKGLGALGCVTNGSMRDLTDSAPGFQLLAGRVGPSHAHVHAVDFGGQVNVHGMTVAHGDIIHADRHGAVVVPAEAVMALPAAIDLIARREAELLKAARAPDFDIDKLKAAMAAAAEIH